MPNPLVAVPYQEDIAVRGGKTTRSWLAFFQRLTTFMQTGVSGPTASTDNAIAIWNGTTGTQLANSVITIPDDAVPGTLSGTNTGDQNTFEYIGVVDQPTITAGFPGDTLNVGAGTNISITTDPNTNLLLISAVGEAGGTVSTTGSPAAGNLTMFSGTETITNGDLSGAVTTSGTLVTTIPDGSIVYAKLQDMPMQTILGRDLTGTGSVEAITISQALDWLN